MSARAKKPSSTASRAKTKPRSVGKAKPRPVAKAKPRPAGKAKPRPAGKKPPAKVKAPAWELRLYISGRTPRSRTAITHINRICEEHLAGRYRLTVVDIREYPALARDEQIVAVPALIRFLPSPLQRLIGDLSQTDRVLFGLDLKPTT